MEFYLGKGKANSKFLNVKGRQVLTFGAPLYRFKQEKDIQSVNFLEEEEIIQRTNDFIPAGNRHSQFTEHQVRAILQPVPEAHNIDPLYLARLVTEDEGIRKQYEQYDPLRGSSLISISAFEEPIYIFSSGNSLSTVVFAIATKKKCKIDDFEVEARFDNINIIDLIDLQYPIQQIVESPLMNRENGGVIGVRTTSTITLFKLDNSMTVTKLHHFHLAENTSIYPDIDYSMPCDLALSPFSESQYLFITNNGFMALMDISRDELIFEAKDEMSDDLDYMSRWRACSFTHMPSKYLICSPECIKEWTVTKSNIRSRIISVPNERIFCFTFKYPILCYSTIEEVRIFDIRNTNEPIIDWIHEMRDGPPTHTFIIPESTTENQYIIGAYSTISDRLSLIQLYYNSELTTDTTKNVEIKDYFRLELSRNIFEPIYKNVEIIPSVGLSSCLTLIPENGYLFYSIYRLFENGEIRVQYIMLGKTIRKGDNKKIEFTTKPAYNLDDDRFEKLYLAVEITKLPSTLDSSKGREIAHIKNQPFREYLEYISEFNEDDRPFSSTKKIEVAEMLLEAKTPVTYHELFGKEGYYNLNLEDMLSHLEEMKEIERAEALPYLDPLIKGTKTDNISQFPDQSKNLKEAHEKEISLSKIRLHVPPYNDNSSFRYLPRDIKYKSTMTTRILADDWLIDNTPSNEIEYAIVNEDKEIDQESFPLASLSRRRKSVSFALDTSIPSISFTSPPPRNEALVAGESASMFDEIGGIPDIESTQDSMDSSQHLTPQISSQVLPGRHGGRPLKKASSKKKKKQKTSGFR